MVRKVRVEVHGAEETALGGVGLMERRAPAIRRWCQGKPACQATSRRRGHAPWPPPAYVDPAKRQQVLAVLGRKDVLRLFVGGGRSVRPNVPVCLGTSIHR